MSSKKTLISYNTRKHPLVAQFFNSLEGTNLKSHETRKAIEFYMTYKNKITDPQRIGTFGGEFSGTLENGGNEDQSDNVKLRGDVEKNEENEDLLEWNPHDL